MARVTWPVYAVLVFASAALPLVRGDAKDNGRLIIGGQEAAEGEFPWQVVFKFVKESQIFCGGSIIDESWILTAAHCVVDLPDDFFIVAGEYSLKSNDGTEQKRLPDQIIMHEEYDKDGNSENDVALIKMDLPLEFNDVINVVNLPNSPTQNGTLCTISGWGARSDSSFDPDFPDVLQKVIVPVVTDEVCQEGCEDLRCVIEESMMCAGFEEGGKDSCQGDSGGPLVCSDVDGNTYQAGVVSTGYGCALPELYGIYTELWFYTDWIQDILEEPSYTTEFPSGSNISSALSLLVAVLAIFRQLVQ